MFCVFRLVFTHLFLGVLLLGFQTHGQLTSVTTDEFGLITTQQPEGDFWCTGSDVSYDLDDLCDGTAICPQDDDEFLCSDKDFKSCKTPEQMRCFNTTGTCVQLTSICDGKPDCADQSDEIYCEAVNCSSTCSFCSKVGASCDMNGLINNLGSLTLPSTIRYLKLTNFSDLQYGLPITQAEYPLLTRLLLSGNGISAIGQRVFENMTSLRTLDLSGNKISALSRGSFQGMPRLQNLYLHSNKISVVHRDYFSDLKNLVWLDLGHNKLESISSGTFQDLGNITDLILRNNSISMIETGAFSGLDKITGISFTDNKLTELRKGMLDGLSSVEWISFRRNPLSYIEPGTFDNTNKIQNLQLVEVQLNHLEPDMFRGIESIQYLSTDDYRLCCLFDSADQCSQASMSSLDSCTRLMPNNVLRIAMWVLGFGALFGNTMVIFIRCRKKRSNTRNHAQVFFISNLAIADWFMGIFMIIIASADTYYGEYYFLKAPHWRSSGLCRFAGALAILSSESSVFFLTIITVDRFLSVVFPFSRFKFHSESARVCVGITWVITIIISLGPVVIGSFVPGFYGLSDVCIGLPLSVDSTGTGTLVYDHTLAIPVFTPNNDGSLQPSWIYSIVLFLGINLICFLFILICYIIIFVQVRKSANSIGKDRKTGSPHDQEVRIAFKMAIIVGTDFLCWMPVIIMGILSQARLVELPVSLYAWSAVFILPINSTLNPYLYTFTEFIGQKKKRANASQKSMKTISTVVANKSSEHDTRL
ncbi:G-protein coupled receptor GRL101-like isoform X2 [Strongylocentrotus purpuratus]|uniref:G-protein coupled receptors family 1 profile domain-containing protein n=1 Tax=Strongylocentrotus purpuratus TaxID=7668 RepID=A0A7M7NLR0_STRPU|nr:G-protein coupled receptor GRL101-like isoform X1 [Strongylocentrotus purpuratus]XP_030838156.1 G-protein coupled receptor GRL101-like isoform X2 [Strongylocentrotus purpuratus]